MVVDKLTDSIAINWIIHLGVSQNIWEMTYRVEVCTLRVLFLFTVVTFNNCFTTFVTLLLFSVPLLADKELRKKTKLCRVLSVLLDNTSIFLQTL